MQKSKILNLVVLIILGVAISVQSFSLAKEQEKERIEEEQWEKEERIEYQLKNTISGYFRKNGVNNQTKKLITTVFQKCETSAKDPFLRKICKEINKNFLGTIKTSQINLSKIKKYFNDNGVLELGITYGKKPIGKNILTYWFNPYSPYYTVGDYILGIGCKAESEFGNERLKQYYPYSFDGVAILKKGNTHRQPAFQMKEIGNGIGKGNDTAYIKNKNGKMVIGVMEDYDFNSANYANGKKESAIFREFTLQDNNSWKLTQCIKRRILSPDIDGGDELVFGFKEFYQDDDNKKMLPMYKTEILPLAKCGNEVEITTVLE